MEAIPWRLVGTCVFGLALITAVFLDLRPRSHQEVAEKTSLPQPLERYLPPSASATLISALNCQWRNGRIPLEEGTPIRSEQLELVSGTVDLLFGNGARVILEGPARFKVVDAGRAVLDYGKVAVQVPRRAIGFTITTPIVDVVDFGTEFGVAVSLGGIVDVAVLVGKVEVGGLPGPFGSRQWAESEKHVLTAGQAVTARQTANRELTIDAADFNVVLANSLAKPFESLARLPSKNVAYGIPDRTAGNRRDFHGGVGLDFEVREPIRIFSLGVFDHLGDGIDPSTSPTVQLWSRDDRGTPGDTSDDMGREMLASQVFVAGDLNELKEGHRFKPLPKPLELQPGAYSIVAYDLADGNPFISAPLNESGSGGIVPAGKNLMSGLAGGVFARNDNESYYGDTSLNQVLTLATPISAKGTLMVSEAETMKGKFFVGHFSSSTADDRREFIGAEFVQGDFEGWIGVRARIYRFNGSATDDSFSPHVNLSRGLYRFDYTYDPNYEADGDHNGPEGRLALHIYNDSGSFGTVYAINAGSHRDANSAFDSFGMGIATMESDSSSSSAESKIGDDPTATAKLFIDNVTYSGHKGLVDFDVDPDWKRDGNTSDGNDYGWVEQASKIASIGSAGGGLEIGHGSIVPVGSRLGARQPGSFPVIQRREENDYAAGSFEYVSQQRQDTR